jgi:MFS family permease
MIPFVLFKNRAFATLFFISLFMCIAYASVMVYLPYYIQNIMGLSATASGLLIVPKSILSIFLSAFYGVYLSKTARYKQSLLFMLSSTALSYLMMFWNFHGKTKLPYFFLATLLNGIGSSTMIVITLTLVMTAVPSNLAGTGSSFIIFTSAFGGALGNAAGGFFTNKAWSKITVPAVLTEVLGDENLAALRQLNILANSNRVEEIRSALPAELYPVLDDTIFAFRETLNEGLKALYIFFFLVTLIALGLTGTLKQKDCFTHSDSINIEQSDKQVRSI